MKKTALLAAVAALFSATPAMAAGGWVGVEHTENEFGLISDLEFETVEAEFAVGFGGQSWGAQLEGSFGSIEGEAEINTQAAHLWYAGQNWRFGAFVQRADLGDPPGGEMTYGIEGTFDVNAHLVLFASAAWSDYLEGSDEYEHVDLGVNFYATPNLRFGATYGIGERHESGGDLEAYGFSAEYQPFSAPISFTMATERYEEDSMFSIAYSDATMFGVRWNFGAETLRDRDNITPFNARGGFLARVLAVY